MPKLTHAESQQQEINSLKLKIASLRYDYEVSFLNGSSLEHRRALADERCSLEFQLKCFTLNNLSKLPYNIKLLYAK